MKVLTSKISFFLLLFLLTSFVVAQPLPNNNDDLLKESLYKKYKQEVLNYSLKNFDQLFLDFLSKQNNPKITLTKEEFYTFTMKIAIFSERQAKLFKSKKNEAQANVEDYKSRNYTEYLAQKTAK